MTFRVHFSDGEKLDVSANNPDEARSAAIKRKRPMPGVSVVKIKIMRT